MKPGRIALLVLGIVGAIVIGSMYFGEDHQKFVAFEAKRDAWHARCDALVKADLRTSAPARECRDDLNELVAYAKANGWQ